MADTIEYILKYTHLSKVSMDIAMSVCPFIRLFFCIKKSISTMETPRSTKFGINIFLYLLSDLASLKSET